MNYKGMPSRMSATTSL